MLKTKALQHDIDAMQVMAYFYAYGKYIERHPKQALYYLIEIAKVKLDEESFDTAMGFLLHLKMVSMQKIKKQKVGYSI